VSHVSRRSFLKKAVPVIAGVGLAGALRIDPIFGATSNTRPTQGTQLSTASYIVYYQDNFYAQNGTTGVIDYSGTDAATVIQAAIDALTEGGLIILRRGIYALTSCIRVSKGIHLLGEKGAVLRVDDGAQSSTNPFNILEVTGDNVTVENLELDGNAASNPNLAGTTPDPPPANPNIQSGIVFFSGRNGEIVNCYLHDLWNAGIWLAALDGDVIGTEIGSCQIERVGKSYVDGSSTNPPQSANAVYILRLQGSTSGSNIHDNVIRETCGRGIYLHFDTDSIVSSNILVKTPNSISESAGITIDDDAKRITVRGNQITGHGPGIFVAWAGCEDIIIEANHCIDAPGSAGSGYGILVDSIAPLGPTLRTLIIKGNICRDSDLAGISVSASETIIEGNICYNNHQASGVPTTRKAGIIVQGGAYPNSSDISIIGNRCFDDQSTPTQNFGISVAQMASQITNVIIANNDLRGNGEGGIGELDCSSIRVTGNLGYNPQGLEQVTVGDSPFSYTNRDGVPEAVYITGGTVSEISKGGILIFTSTPATVWLEPDESLTIVHLDSPRVLKDKH